MTAVGGWAALYFVMFDFFVAVIVLKCVALLCLVHSCCVTTL